MLILIVTLKSSHYARLFFEMVSVFLAREKVFMLFILNFSLFFLYPIYSVTLVKLGMSQALPFCLPRCHFNDHLNIFILCNSAFKPAHDISLVVIPIASSGTGCGSDFYVI